MEFLALLLDDEIERRHQRRFRRREREAGFESLKRLADFTAIPTLDRALVLEMATCLFVQAKENGPLGGPTGWAIATRRRRSAMRPSSAG